MWRTSDLNRRIREVVTRYPVSANGHLTFRIRKIDEEQGMALEVVTTIDDPTYYTAKWSTLRSFEWRPDKSVFNEYNCESQLGRPDGLTRCGYQEDTE